MSAAEPRKLVALLARPGAARERLRAALDEAGALIVLEADPAELEGGAIAAAGAEAVLVALEPAVEEALERLETALHAPGLRLIFDEAELAARREGWSAQRWVRHLAAKLHGHDDVLPPGREEDAPQPQPGRPPTPAQLQDGAALDPHLREAAARAADLPRDDVAAAAAGFAGILQDEPEPWIPRQPSASPTLALEPLESLEPMASAPESKPGQPEQSEPPLPASWTIGGDDGVSASAALGEATPAGVAPASPLRLELEAVDASSAAAGVGGAVLVVAGIGGPDAIRKLLDALAPGFDRPLLLKLRLDGGRYDNLVKQLGRVSPLPVALAEAERPMRPGTAYVLPDEVGLAVADGRLAFAAATEGVAGVVAALPAEDSAMLMLSGGDPALVDAALALAARGGFVAAQSGEGCYDPSGPDALAAHGIERDAPAGLAQRLVQHRPQRR